MGAPLQPRSKFKIYMMRPLLAGEVVFNEIGMLQAGEFDCETILDMAHDAA